MIFPSVEGTEGAVGSTTCSDIEADNAAPNWIWPERSTFARARLGGGL